MKNQFNIKTFRPFYIAILSFVLFGIFFVTWYYLNPRWKPASLDHSPNGFRNFELIWVQNEVYAASSPQASYIVAAENTIIVYGSLSNNRKARLLGLDWDSRKILWEHSVGSPFSGAVNTMAANSHLVFIGFDGTGKTVSDSIAEAGRVRAYELSTGNIWWTSPIPGARRINSIAANDIVVSVDGGSVSRDYYLFNADTGTVIDTIAKGGSWDDNHFYATINHGILYDFFPETSSSFTDDFFWANTLKDNKVYRPPIRQNGVVVMQQIEQNRTKQFKAFSEETGQPLWSLDLDIVSNLAASKSSVFVLTRDGRLMAIDLETSEIIGTVEFGDVNGNVEDFGFYVASYKDKVLVYLGDSRTLFALRFLREE